MATETLRIELESVGEEETVQATDRTAEGVDRLGESVSGVTAIWRQYSSVITGAVVVAAARWVNSQIDSIDVLGKTAAQIGANIDALSEYRLVTSLSGVEFDAFTSAIERGTVEIERSAAGTGRAAEALDALGLSFEDLAGLGSIEQFEQIAEAMEDVDSATERLTLTTAIYGRGGADLVKILSQGEEAIAGMRAEAEELGYTLTNEQVQAAAEYADQVTILTGAFGSLFETVVLLLAGPLATLLDWLNSGIRAIVRTARAIRDWARDFLGLEAAADDTSETISALNRITEEYRRNTDSATEATEGIVIEINKAEEATIELNAAKEREAELLAMVRAESEEYRARLETQAAAEREAADATRERSEAITGVVTSLGVLFGVTSQQSVNAAANLLQSLGSLAGIDSQLLAGLGAAAATGAIGGGLVGGGGRGSQFGGAGGAALGFAAGGPVGALLGAIAGGLIGGTFDTTEQASTVFGTFRDLPGAPRRGRFGQRSFVDTGALGQILVGGRDGQGLTQSMIDFAGTLSTLDDVVGQFVDGSQERLERAQAAAQRISNETRSENFDAAANILIRYQAIFDSIGGVESALFDAFGPDGETVPQVIAAISIVRDLGEGFQELAVAMDATDRAFLSGVAALAEISQIITADDPIGDIRESIERLSESLEASQGRVARSTLDLIGSYDGSIESTIALSGSLQSLTQATASALAGIDAARQSASSATEGALTRVRQSFLTPEQIFEENIQRAGELLLRINEEQLGAGQVAQLVQQLSALVTSGFFGLDEEQRAERRAEVEELLEAGQQQSEEAFARQEQLVIEQHQQALKAARLQIEGANQTITAASELSNAAAALNQAAAGQEVA